MKTKYCKTKQKKKTQKNRNRVVGIEKYKKFSEAREFRITFPFLSLNQSYAVICEVNAPNMDYVILNMLL